jgi:glucans biosynthesis protein C
MTQPLPEPSGNRILFIDNIRYLMIVFVVILHAALSYAPTMSWWYAWDPVTNSRLFDVIVGIIDVFIMPVLFFIAGYFALPNIQKKGTGVFLKDKFIRLGIPWLIGVIFIAPISTYIACYKIYPMSYGQFWINWIKSAGDFHTGFLYSPINLDGLKEEIATGRFNHTAYWFISLLLFFFIMFGIIYALKKRFLPSSSIHGKTHSGKTMLLVILFVGFLSIMMSVLVSMTPSPYPAPWLMIANVLQFQTWRLTTFIIYFALGVYAFHRNWFVKDNFPGHPLLWMTICIILFFGFLVTMSNLISNPANTGYIITYVSLSSYLRVALLILFTSFAARYWNRPHNINETLAANSYNIYLVHLPIVVVLQLLLVNLSSTSSLMKFGIVFALSFLMSYAISNYAIKPHPRLSVATVVVIFLLMVIFVYPRV